MTDTSIRVSSDTRQRLKIYAAQESMTQDEAIWHLLNKVDAPEIPENER